MKVYPRVLKFIEDHTVDGVWTGMFYFGQPAVTIDGEIHLVETIIGKKLSDKYTEETNHEGMGTTLDDGDTTVDGNGVSESEE